MAEVASAQVIADKPGRLLIAVLSADQRWLSFGSLPVSFGYLGESASAPPTAGTVADASARFLPIPGTPEGNDRQPTLTLPADGRGLYAVEAVTFPRAGYWEVTINGVLDGAAWTANAAFEVLAKRAVITVGDVAPMTDNPVIGDQSVAASAIDSRARDGEVIPDPELHSVSIADAIRAHHPAVIVFSTPVYCVSRFCGPVTDMIASLAKQYADRADFIHVEIYRNFDAGQINDAARDWLITPTGDLREPWAFLVGADGRIAGSWDTMVTRGELEPVLRALPPKG